MTKDARSLSSASSIAAFNQERFPWSFQNFQAPLIHPAFHPYLIGLINEEGCDAQKNCRSPHY